MSIFDKINVLYFTYLMYRLLGRQSITCIPLGGYPFPLHPLLFTTADRTYRWWGRIKVYIVVDVLFEVIITGGDAIVIMFVVSASFLFRGRIG